MAYLVDTNILVYRCDFRFPEKQSVAIQLLRDGIDRDEARVPHQAVMEFVAVGRRLRCDDGSPLLPAHELIFETESILRQFTILYPDQHTIQLALQGMNTYQINWFDAHLWAYAQQYGLSCLYSEDFQHKRYYGSVQVLNPFVLN